MKAWVHFVAFSNTMNFQPILRHLTENIPAFYADLNRRCDLVQERADKKREEMHRLTMLIMGSAIGMPLVLIVMGKLTAVQAMFAMQLGLLVIVAALHNQAYVTRSLVMGLVMSYFIEYYEAVGRLFDPQLYNEFMRVVGEALQPRAGPVRVDTERARIIAEIAIQHEPAINPIPMLAEDAHDPISGHDFVYGIGYVLNNSINTPVSEATLTELYITPHHLHNGLNPFTNLAIQRIRKVRIRGCHSQQEINELMPRYIEEMNANNDAVPPAAGAPVPPTGTGAVQVNAPRGSALHELFRGGNWQPTIVPPMPLPVVEPEAAAPAADDPLAAILPLNAPNGTEGILASLNRAAARVTAERGQSLDEILARTRGPVAHGPQTTDEDSDIAGFVRLANQMRYRGANNTV